MRTKIVPIGNSRGIRLPKAILEAARLEDAVNLKVEEGRLVITPARNGKKLRAGWSNAIRAEIERLGPTEIDSDFESLQNSWDKREWRW
jgi:antitoxin MazE